MSNTHEKEENCKKKSAKNSTKTSLDREEGVVDGGSSRKTACSTGLSAVSPVPPNSHCTCTKTQTTSIQAPKLTQSENQNQNHSLSSSSTLSSHIADLANDNIISNSDKKRRRTEQEDN